MLTLLKQSDGAIVVKLQNDDSTNSQMQQKLLVYPFCNVANTSADIVIKPASGTFLKHFTESTGLHAGIVAERALLFHYDRNGLQVADTRSSNDWDHSLPLNFVSRLQALLGYEFQVQHVHDCWSASLEETLAERDVRWSDEAYQSDSNNCFDFVVTFVAAFIKHLSVEYDLRPLATVLSEPLSKIDFCKHFICPVTKPAVEYLHASQLFHSRERVL